MSTPLTMPLLISPTWVEVLKLFVVLIRKLKFAISDGVNVPIALKITPVNRGVVPAMEDTI